MGGATPGLFSGPRDDCLRPVCPRLQSIQCLRKTLTDHFGDAGIPMSLKPCLAAHPSQQSIEVPEHAYCQRCVYQGADTESLRANTPHMLESEYHWTTASLYWPLWHTF